jgi:hypothetical protein
LLADARDPSWALAFFTFAAASDVLAARLAGDGHTVAAAVLMAAGRVGWLLLSYSLPLLLVGTHGQRDLAHGERFFRGRARPPVSLVVAFIEACREQFGVEPVCRALRQAGVVISPSGYYAAWARPPAARAVRDAAPEKQVLRVYKDSGERYGAWKVWDQLNREGITVARYTVERGRPGGRSPPPGGHLDSASGQTFDKTKAKMIRPCSARRRYRGRQRPPRPEHLGRIESPPNSGRSS